MLSSFVQFQRSLAVTEGFGMVLLPLPGLVYSPLTSRDHPQTHRMAVSMHSCKHVSLYHLRIL